MRINSTLAGSFRADEEWILDTYAKCLNVVLSGNVVQDVSAMVG